MTIISPLPPPRSAFDSEHELQLAAAERRMTERAQARHSHQETLARAGGLAKADDPDRITRRLARIASYYSPGAPAVVPEQSVDRGVEVAGAAMAQPGVGLEKIINAADFLGVRYLDDGVLASRTIGRVLIGGAHGRPQGFGTGFLVSGDLLLTNHHVLPDAQTARTSSIEFDYQDGAGGSALTPRTFMFDPDRFFIADRQRDFALVAVTDVDATLGGYGCARLTAAQGTVIIGEYVTIVQHPGGRKKEIVLRENKILDIPEGFVHYNADTEPGSSGSPVFNDQWEVVALHHASVPAPDPGEPGNFRNEGIRISSIIGYLRSQSFPTLQQALVDAVLEPDARRDVPATPIPVVEVHSADVAPVAAGSTRTLTVSVPVEITVRVGAETAGQVAVGSTEAISIDPDYSTRAGYDPMFLGTWVPLPTPPPALAAAISEELRYHHFSLMMHRRRRMALFTAVNIDGAQATQLSRERDRWIRDPRLPDDEQTDEDLYARNDLDRGHLVRRLDPAWGERAKQANDDTFHFTNCTPQHHDFNAGRTLWLGLEDYVLRNSATHAMKVSVLTGPVLADDDPPYRGVALPRQYWKVVSICADTAGLASTGYLLSQEALLDEFAAGPEAFSYGAYRTYQVPVRRIADLTGLDLSIHVSADPLERIESTGLARELVRPADLILC